MTSTRQEQRVLKLSIAATVLVAAIGFFGGMLARSQAILFDGIYSLVDVALTLVALAVLRLMAGGYSNREIAGSLFLAEGTVKNYVSTILDKLDTRDRPRAVLKAITLRII